MKELPLERRPTAHDRRQHDRKQRQLPNIVTPIDSPELRP
jgi:hypothetical protein